MNEPVSLLIDCSNEITDSLKQTNFPYKTAVNLSKSILNIFPTFWTNSLTKQTNLLKSAFHYVLGIEKQLILQQFPKFLNDLKHTIENEKTYFNSRFAKCCHCNKPIKDPVTLSDRRIVDRGCAIKDFSTISYKPNFDYISQISKIDYPITIIINQNNSSYRYTFKAKCYQKIGFVIQLLKTKKNLGKCKVFSQDGEEFDIYSTTLVTNISALFFVDRYVTDDLKIQFKTNDSSQSLTFKPWMLFYHVLFQSDNIEEFSSIEIHTNSSIATLKPGLFSFVTQHITKETQFCQISTKVINHFERFRVFQYLSFCKNFKIITFNKKVKILPDGILDFSDSFGSQTKRRLYDAIHLALRENFCRLVIFTCGNDNGSKFNLPDNPKITSLKVINLSNEKLKDDFVQFISTNNGEIVQLKSLDELCFSNLQI